MLHNNPSRMDCPSLKQMPVSLRYFTESDEYIGKSLRSEELLYPYWKKFLYNECDIDNKMSEILLDGSIGVGKSLISAVLASWQLYNILIMEDWKDYFKMPNCTVSFVFTNEITFGRFTELVLQSKFLHKYVARTSNNAIVFENGIEAFLTTIDNLASKDSTNFLLGKNVIFANIHAFPKNNQSEMYKIAYCNVRNRVHSRFGVYRGLIITETDSIEQTRDFRNFLSNLDDNGTFRHICEPQWKIRPRDNYSDETFKILYNENEIDIIESLDDLPDDDGSYKLINVPCNLLSDFKHDPVGSMQILAGIDALRYSVRFNLDFQTVINYLKDRTISNLIVYRSSSPEAKYTVDRDGHIVRLHNRSRVNGFGEEAILANDWVVTHT